MNFAEKLKLLRMERGITQEQLAETLHVTQPAVAKWERGVALPDLAILYDLSVYFTLPINEFFTREEMEGIRIEYRESQFERRREREEPMFLSMQNVSKWYEKEACALRNINLSFPERGMVFIVGKSGSGKSTLLSILGGLISPTEGEVYYQGMPYPWKSDEKISKFRRECIGFFFQTKNLLHEFNVKENVGMMVDQIDHKKISSVLESVGLKGFENRKIKTLSVGQCQRVALARALVKEPKLILADEPTANLDYATSEQIFMLLKAQSQTRLVVVVTHDKASAFTYGDRIIELSDGSVLLDRNKIKSGE